jgi:transposase InsO family protein
VAYEHGVTLQFIRPSKPVEDAYCESFNGKLRDGCLNAKWAVEPTEFAKALRDENPSTPQRATA